MPDDPRFFPPGKLPGPFLSRLISQYRTPPDDSVVVNAAYGFDAAAIAVPGDTLLVKSDPITFATSDAARYVVSVNANDIACMGGIPRWMTVVALLPEGRTTPDSVETLFADLRDACMAEGITLVGGHTEITVGLDRPLLIGTLLGTAGEHGLLRPGGARAGDDLFVTKAIGLEGTALLASERTSELARLVGDDLVQVAKEFLHRPGISVTRDAGVALASGLVTALHDPTEGGLSTAVHEIAGASGLGARIDADAVPILPETARICAALNLDPLGLLSSGALLITAEGGNGAAMQAAFDDARIPLTRIGALTRAEAGCTIIRGGKEHPLPRFDSDELTRALTP